jgi:hypothetical protein
MLVVMDIPAAAAGPWIVLGVALGIVVVLLATVGAVWTVRRRRRPVGTPGDGAAPNPAVDDLAAFLEFPPGTASAPSPPRDGWAQLSSVSAPAPAPGSSAPPRRRDDAVGVVTALAIAVLLLVGAAAAVAATSRTPDPAPAAGAIRTPAEPSAPDGGSTRLAFGGVVLEQRAVGVTATYPTVRVTWDGRGSRATVELPTFNCLTDEAPADPVAAGCLRAVPEYAELSSPALEVWRAGDGLHISGRFPTTVRPNGSAPVPTGRVYELVVTVTPGEGTASGDVLPAEGVLQLGGDRARTTREGPNELRYPS